MRFLCIKSRVHHICDAVLEVVTEAVIEIAYDAAFNVDVDLISTSANEAVIEI
jgi:hypothetical protein